MLNKLKSSHSFLLFAFLGTVAGLHGREVRFDAPASHFTESTPLGNGRLGIMLFGDPFRETIVLNESGMWSGAPQEADRIDAHTALPAIQQLLREGRYLEAETLVDANFTCKGQGSGKGVGANVPYGCYQTLGKLHLDFHYPEGQAPSGYERTLDLGNCHRSNQLFCRKDPLSMESFVSKPDEIAVLKLSVQGSDTIEMDLFLDRGERFHVNQIDPETLCMSGQLNDGYDGETGVRYASCLTVETSGGSATPVDGVIRVKNASEVRIYFSAATDIRTFAGRRVEDPLLQASEDLQRAKTLGYGELKRRHMEDYRQYFDRVALQLGPETSVGCEAGKTPTAYQRLQALEQGVEDPDLFALYFDFGRYLLISSSRPGGLPANLQGIWAEELQTPWNGDWHTNINVQMNYWPAEICNLTELHQPLFSLIASLVEPGRKTAKAYYDAEGWVGFLLANPWGYTSPGESASWGSTVSCSAWLCQHLWDHYLFTRDLAFLRWAYPILKGAAEFYQDILVPTNDGRWLVTSPSNSPENAFLTDSGKPAHVCMGTPRQTSNCCAIFFRHVSKPRRSCRLTKRFD